MKLSHVLWNVAGLSLPLVAAVASIPTLLLNVGSERFGLLSLSWALIGYAGILDFGVGRALTKTVSSMLGAERESEVPSALLTALRIAGAISFCGFSILVLLVFFGVLGWVKVNSIPDWELTVSALLFSLALPLQTLSMTYKGVNEAYLNFKSISIIRVFLGVATFILPLILSFYTQNLIALVASLVFSRLLAVLAYRFYALQCISHVKGVAFYSPEIKSLMLQFGGWFSVSGILNPILGSLDKLLLAGLVSASAVSIYSIPYDMVVQSLVLVGAITTVAFPYLSAKIEESEESARKAFFRILLICVVLMGFISLCIYFFGDVALRWWLHAAYANESGLVAKCLVFGLIPYTIGTVCISYLHAHGRTDISGKLNLFGFFPFCLLIYWLIRFLGPQGAAIAWVVRVSIEGLLILMFSLKAKRLRRA